MDDDIWITTTLLTNNNYNNMIKWQKQYLAVYINWSVFKTSYMSYIRMYDSPTAGKEMTKLCVKLSLCSSPLATRCLYLISNLEFTIYPVHSQSIVQNVKMTLCSAAVGEILN